jgi:hypothetical protein
MRSLQQPQQQDDWNMHHQMSEYLLTFFVVHPVCSIAAYTTYYQTLRGVLHPAAAYQLVQLFADTNQD